ncbi:hypothetical protein Nepgr_001215 [Nepenthes gracilis]|uniref:AP2/ERF domain-containing protein n=1 Tax=Nepenthes gracilis TaxID=150966 RepID=A0AAD3RX96_NEPGR|nr:hypothetical protein Nepgr_001215 [Nepenthes gracilis]
MFDLNIDIASDNLVYKERKATELTAEMLPECSGFQTEPSGTSNSSSVVLGGGGDEDSNNSSVDLNIDVFRKLKTPNEVDENFSMPVFVTKRLFPLIGDGDGGGGVGSELESRVGSSQSEWLNLSVSGEQSDLRILLLQQQQQQQKQQVRKSRRGPRSRSSQYRGVTFYRRTGRWESHIWDCGKQVYLGGFDTEHAAAIAYDRAAIKFRGVGADINFIVSDYEEDIKQTRNLTKEEFVHLLRRQSTRFSRSSSRYRGVTLHKCGGWEARMGQVVGNKAYDKAAIQCNGRAAVINFEPSTYKGETPIVGSSGGSGYNLDLSLRISPPSENPKGDVDTKNFNMHHGSSRLPNGRILAPNGGFAYPSGGYPLYGQPLASRQSIMRLGALPGLPATYEEIASEKKFEIFPQSRLSNWARYPQAQSGANPIPRFPTAASSGFSLSTKTTTTLSGGIKLIPLSSAATSSGFSLSTATASSSTFP